MRKLLLLVALSNLSSFSFSQIHYQKTLKETFEKAKAENKPIFICIMPSRFIYHTWFMLGLKKKDVADLYNKTFINYLGYETDNNTLEEINKYPLLKSSSHNLYLNSKGQLLYQSTLLYPDARPYFVFADSATCLINYHGK